MTEIGARILEARRKRGMSQKDLAEALGVSVQAVSQWENGKTDPSSRIGRLSAALHCDALWLSGDAEHQSVDSLRLYSDVKNIPVIKIEEIENYLSFISSSRKIQSEEFVVSTVEPVGELFCIRAPRDLWKYKKGDVLIFDNGIEALQGDTAAIIIMNQSVSQLINSPKAAAAQRPVMGAVAQIDGPVGSDPTQLRRMVVAMDEYGKEIESAVLIVATLVEHRTFRHRQSSP